MMRWFWRLALRLFGWKVEITVPDYPKCIICVAPHTSNWDFVLGEFAYWSVGRRAHFLIKQAWFKWPMSVLFTWLGGIPVPRLPGSSLVDSVITMFQADRHLAVAITPEGTRSRTAQWHTGFLRIAIGANVPIVLGILDYGSRQIIIRDTFKPTGDIEADMRAVKDFYKPYQGRYPEKFTTD